MILHAVIVKDDKKRLRQIIKTAKLYATSVDNRNKSKKLSFYKSEEAAKINYPKKINGIIYITIDTVNMEFFGEGNVPVTEMPEFLETDSEYVFSFGDEIKDLHCKINIVKYSFCGADRD